MSLAGTLMTPRVDSRIRRRLLVGKCKRIDFKDILRERFNHRIKENRRTLLEKIRLSKNTVDVQDTLSGYLASEMDGFRTFVRQNTPRRLGIPQSDEDDDFNRELEEIHGLHEEFLEEQFSWIMDEYRKEEEQIQALMSEWLACPLCKHGVLQKQSNEYPITCTTCHLHLPSSVSMDHLGTTIQQNFNEHSVGCPSDPQFMLISEYGNNNLFMICSSCSIFNALN